jgi:hypothetical protein
LVGVSAPALAGSSAAPGHNLWRGSARVADHYTARAAARVVAHKVVVSGLDNPRQLAWSNSKALLIAEAGHGSYKDKNCSAGGPEGTICIGRTGKITRIASPATTTNTNAESYRIARGFLSGASPDGTFAVGSDGVDQGNQGRIYVQETYAPPDILPQGIGGRQSGKLLTLKKDIVASITAYERNHDPDGEGFDSDPYAVLALKNGQLSADAAGDDILKVRHGKKSLWALLPGDTAKVDPVPTSFSKGPNGRIYVGTLYSLQPHQARVLRYNRSGEFMRSWGRFTSVTGVAVRRDGTMFVSELFTGCPPDDANCIPGRVVRVDPNGDRTRMAVPFPAGLETRGRKLYVSAWSIAPANGAFGNPAFSGQVWRIPVS